MMSCVQDCLEIFKQFGFSCREIRGKIKTFPFHFVWEHMPTVYRTCQYLNVDLVYIFCRHNVRVSEFSGAF